jgi:hypothetical protein
MLRAASSHLRWPPALWASRPPGGLPGGRVADAHHRARRPAATTNKAGTVERYHERYEYENRAGENPPHTLLWVLSGFCGAFIT